MRTTVIKESRYSPGGPLYPRRQARTNPKINGRIPTDRKGTRESCHQAETYWFNVIDSIPRGNMGTADVTRRTEERRQYAESRRKKVLPH
jgi:hypothetical protein